MVRTGDMMAKNELAAAEDARRMNLEKVRREWATADRTDERAYQAGLLENKEISRLAEKGQDRLDAKETEATLHTRNRGEALEDQKTTFSNQMKVAQFGVDNREPKEKRGEAGKLYDDLSEIYGPEKAKEMVQQSLTSKTKGGLTEAQAVRYETDLAKLEGEGITKETVGVANAYRKTLGMPLLKEQKVADGEKHWFKADEPPVTKFVPDAGSLPGGSKGKAEAGGADTGAQGGDSKAFTLKLADTYANIPVEQRESFLNEAKKRYSPNVIADATMMVNDREKSPKKGWTGGDTLAPQVSREEAQVYKIAQDNNWPLEKAWDYFKKTFQESSDRPQSTQAMTNRSR
jgi:hypothetical protein